LFSGKLRNIGLGGANAGSTQISISSSNAFETSNDERLDTFLAAERTLSHHLNMSEDRRRETRSAMGGRFANKYIDGMPYMVELLDASMDGIAIRRIFEPEKNDPQKCDPDEQSTFALEMCFENIRFWAWAQRVRRTGDREAYKILAADPLDRARLRKFLRTLAA
jgi:hypothetical protein